MTANEGTNSGTEFESAVYDSGQNSDVSFRPTNGSRDGIPVRRLVLIILKHIEWTNFEFKIMGLRF